MENEKRPIDVKAFLRRLQKRREDFAGAWKTLDAMPVNAQIQYHENLECALIAEDMPTVDAVEVVHGRWVNPYMNRYGHPCHCCSVCGFKASYQDKNYCPNCGAKMDGEKENDRANI